MQAGPSLPGDRTGWKPAPLNHDRGQEGKQ